MQCPTCQRTRYRKEWRPSQWIRYVAVTENYFQCKVCDGEVPDWHDGYGDGLPAAGSPGHYSGQRPTSSPTLAFDFEILPEEFQAALGNQDLVAAVRDIMRRLESFVPAWMAMLSHSTRKNFSYYGALVSRGSAPVHYRCPLHDGDIYFDPGNYIYSLAFNMMLPAVAAENNWNAETKGDIIEAILGVVYLKANSDVKDASLFRRWLGLSCFLNRMVFAVWQFCQRYIGREDYANLEQCIMCVSNMLVSSTPKTTTSIVSILQMERAELHVEPRWKLGLDMVVGHCTN